MALRRSRKPRSKTYPCPKCKGTGCKECKSTGKVTTRPKDYVDALYDGFKCKDMTRAAFRAAYRHAVDPMRLHNDLDNLLLTRQIRREMNGGLQRM